MPVKFSPEDVERLKELLKLHPEGGSVANVLSDMMIVQDLANKLKYPINSMRDLVEQLGPERIIERAGVKMKAEELRGVIPAYYFPITSEEDFFDKASELIRQQPGLEPVGKTPEKGGLLPIEKAPAIPNAVLRFKAPSPLAEGGFIGYTEEEVEKGGAQ